MTRALPLGLLVCLATMTLDTTALAQCGDYWPWIHLWGDSDSRTPWAVEGKLHVALELWRIDCARIRRSGRCEIASTMQLEGAATLAVPVGDLVSVILDGEVVALGDPVGENRRHHRVVIPAGHHTLVVTRSEPVGQANQHLPSFAFPTFPVVEQRHPLMHDGVTGRYDVRIVGTGRGSRMPGYTIGIEVVADPELTLSLVGLPEFVCEWRTVGALRQVEIKAGRGMDVNVLVRLQDEGDLVHLGGLLLGLGWDSDSDGSRFLARLEYEIAIADFVLPGLALDMSSHGFVLTPRVELSTPSLLGISLWAGVGMPIRLGTAPDIGVRLIGGLSVGPLGVALSVDLRPGDGGIRTEFGLLGRMSL